MYPNNEYVGMPEQGVSIPNSMEILPDIIGKYTLIIHFGHVIKVDVP